MKKSTISLLILAGCLLFTTGCQKDKQEEDEKAKIVRPVRYTTIKAQDLGENRTFTGTAVAAKESALSFRVAGTVLAINVKVGDRVSAGTLLAELDTTDFQVDIDSSKAGLKTAQADSKSAQTSVFTSRSNYERIEKLYESDNVSLSEFEKARGDYETAVAQFQAAQSRITTETTRLQATQNQLAYTKLTAPFDGIINSIAVEENEEVSSGMAIFSLSGLGDLEVKVDISDRYIASLEPGMTCTVRFPAVADLSFEGVVSEVPYGIADSPTYPVTIRIEKKSRRLRPGMATEVLFHFGDDSQEKGLFIPTDGVGEDTQGNFVFVIDADEKGYGTVTRRGVTLGALTEKGFLVEKGVAEGERVATSGLQILLDGMEVKLLQSPLSQW